MIVREILTRWGFDVDDTALKDLDSRIGSLKTSLKVIGTTAIAAGAAIFGLAKSTANTGDFLRKTSQATGVAAAFLQKMTYAAQLGGVAQEELVNSLRLMANTSTDAGNGIETFIKAYKKVGISQKELKDKTLSSEQIILRVADAFSQMKDGAEKTALAQDIFGRSGSRMIPLLNSGRKGIAGMLKEAEQLGFMFSGDLQKASEEFNDNLERMQYFIAGIKNFLGAKLIPIFNKYLERIVEYVKLNKEMIQEKVIYYIEKLGEALKTVARILAIYYGLKLTMIVGSFATLAASTVKAALGFKVLGNAALIANLKIFAIGLGIIAVIGLIEDLVGLIQGKKSVIESVLGKNFADKIRTGWNQLVTDTADVRGFAKWAWGIGDDPWAKAFAGGVTELDKEPLRAPINKPNASGGTVNNFNINVNGSSNAYQTGKEIGRGISNELEFTKSSQP